MLLPQSAHTSSPWRIHELTRDFQLEDVWALPTPGGPDDFLTSWSCWLRPTRREGPPRPPGCCGRSDGRWERYSTGTAQKPGLGPGWPRSATGCRLICAIRRPPSSTSCRSPRSICSTNEWAAELANQTVHGVIHVGWVPNDTGGYRGQMAVYVKPNGALGTAYMAAIRPFRHRIVYPAMMRQIGASWRRRSSRMAPAGAHL